MRSRNLKPGFFKNEDLLEIEPLGRLLFQGLWCMADRDGRLEDRPKKIKIEVLPCDNCNVDKLLEILDKKGFILRYKISNIKFIQILNFKKHQSPHMKEQNSIIPEPTPDMYGACMVHVPEINDASPSDILIPDSPYPHSLNPSLNTFVESRKKNKSHKVIFDYIKNQFQNIPPEIIEKWQSIYPVINIQFEIGKAEAWVIANPKNKKSNWMRFLVNWMTRAQDKAPRKESNEISGKTADQIKAELIASGQWSGGT